MWASKVTSEAPRELVNASGLSPDRIFFPLIALVCIGYVLYGFAPTYYFKSVQDSPPLSLLVHVHGLLFSAWLALFLVQTILIRSGKPAVHRRLGMIGVWLASVAVLGTRFLASTESRAHPHYKEKLIGAKSEDTVHTILFGHGWPHAPMRLLRTPFVEEWLGKEEQGQQSRPDEPVIGHTIIAGQAMPVLRFMGMPPNADSTGDIELRGLLAGQAVGQIHDIRPAHEIVRDLVDGLREIYRRGAFE